MKDIEFLIESVLLQELFFKPENPVAVPSESDYEKIESLIYHIMMKKQPIKNALVMFDLMNMSAKQIDWKRVEKEVTKMLKFMRGSVYLNKYMVALPKVISLFQNR